LTVSLRGKASRRARRRHDPQNADKCSTLQSLNLPGSIQALERPVGLPPSLLKKAEEVESAGGVDKIHSLLDQVQRLSRQNGQLLSEVSEREQNKSGVPLILCPGDGYSRRRSDREREPAGAGAAPRSEPPAVPCREPTPHCHSGAIRQHHQAGFEQ
jgi:hypothetical protein